MIGIERKSIQHLFNITMQQLGVIQGDLNQGETATFQKWIVSPRIKMLEEWLISTYPSLKKEAVDILDDAFLRFQYVIKKWDSSQGDLDVNKELKSLVQKECKLAVPTKENRQKNLGLSRSEFKDLRKSLKEGKETLIEKVYLSHFEQCISFLMFKESASHEEAYNCSMDALYEIRKDLLRDKIFYGNLAYYFTYRAKNKLYKYRVRKKENTIPLNGLDFEEEERTESELLKKELSELVSEAINKLCFDCKSIIKSFYYDEESLKEIAEKMNKSHAAIRKQTSRCRDKLRKFLGETFYKQFSQNL